MGSEQTPSNATTRRQRGLALIVVLWGAVLLAMLATGIARVARDDVRLAQTPR